MTDQTSLIQIKSTDRIFFLDDDMRRIWAFKDMLNMVGYVQDDKFWIAENVSDAENTLDYVEHPFDIFFLDHDLVSEHYNDLKSSAESGEGTGQEVIAMLSPTKNQKFIIHTMNPYGAEKMLNLLVDEKGVDPKNITTVPFGRFNLELH